MIGFHFQNSPNDWPMAVAKLKAGTITKFLFGVERCREAKAKNPYTKTWYRWVGDQPLPYDNFEQHCRDWLNQFVDGTFRREAEYVDYIQCYNETLAQSQPPEEKARWIALHVAMAKVWHDEYRQEEALSHIRIILCETAIGNDIPWQIAEAAQRYDALLGYHPYVVCRVGKVNPELLRFTVSEEVAWQNLRYDAPRARFRGGGIYRMKCSQEPDYSFDFVPDMTEAINRPDYISPHDWRWYSGRWATMDAEYKARGITVDWGFGEGGPVLDASKDWSGWLDPLGGWRNPDCLDGDLNKYKAVLDYWLQNTFQTPAYKEGRIKGLQLFTSGAPGGSGGQWGNFDLIGDDMQQIAEFSGAYDYPATGEPPTEPPIEPPVEPPVEPPTDCRGLPRTQYARRVSVVPQDATMAEWLSVCEEAYASRQSVGFSYDDAGIGDLDDRTAILYGLQDGQHAEFWDWYKTHYPGVAVEFRDYTDLEPEPTAGIIIDVSHWQGVMDWEKAAATGVTHAYIKATDGGEWLDPEFVNNWAAAKVAGIARGAYHYYRNHITPKAQAAFFLEQLGDDIGEMPPVLDVEDTNNNPDDGDLLEWLQIVDDMTGSPLPEPVIYTAKWYWDKHVGRTNWAQEYNLWVANYTDDDTPILPNDWTTYWLWQYTSSGDGELYGAKSANIDLNRWNGVI